MGAQITGRWMYGQEGACVPLVDGCGTADRQTDHGSLSAPHETMMGLLAWRTQPGGNKHKGFALWGVTLFARASRA